MKFYLGSHRIRSGDSVNHDVAQDEPTFDFKHQDGYRSIEIIHESDTKTRYFGLYDIPKNDKGVEMIAYKYPDIEGLYKVELFSHSKPRNGYFPESGPEAIAPTYTVSFILSSSSSGDHLCQEYTGKYNHGYSHHLAVREDNVDKLMCEQVDKSQLIDYARRHKIRVQGTDVIDYQLAIRNHKDKSWAAIVKR